MVISSPSRTSRALFALTPLIFTAPPSHICCARVRRRANRLYFRNRSRRKLMIKLPGYQPFSVLGLLLLGFGLLSLGFSGLVTFGDVNVSPFAKLLDKLLAFFLGLLHGDRLAYGPHDLRLIKLVKDCRLALVQA